MSPSERHSPNYQTWREIFALLFLAAGLGIAGWGFLGLAVPELATWENPASPDSPGAALILPGEDDSAATVFAGVGWTVGGLFLMV